MSYFEIFMIGIGLSMDAFAAAVCKGLSMRKASFKNIFIIALFFGGFQGMMPVAGYFLGIQFQDYIVSFDHWVAFVLLLFIGGKMVLDVIKGEDDEETNGIVDRLDIKEIFILAIATSIDALAVGISMAFLHVNIFGAAGTIAATTFVLSAIGVLIGKKFGAQYKDKATLSGGIILIAIGVKILVEHLGMIG